MAWDWYNDFLAAAQETYDLSRADAQELYRELRDELGETPDVDDLDDERAQEIADSLRESEETVYEPEERFTRGDYEYDDWVDYWDAWDGEYEDYEVEGNADYED